MICYNHGNGPHPLIIIDIALALEWDLWRLWFMVMEDQSNDVYNIMWFLWSHTIV